MKNQKTQLTMQERQKSDLKRLRRQRNLLLLPWVLVTLPISGPLIYFNERKRRQRAKRVEEIISQSGVTGAAIRPDRFLSNLNHLLWAGQSDSAMQTLDVVINDNSFSEKQRHAACCMLITRYSFLGDLDKIRQCISLVETGSLRYANSFEFLMRKCQFEAKSGDLTKARETIGLLKPDQVNADAKLALANTYSQADKKIGFINEVFAENHVAPIKMKNPSAPLTLSNIEGSETPARCKSAGKVSVIVPVHNGEEFVSRAIRSICEQTYTDLEIILVDDCSTDDSHSILQKIALEDERIHVLQTKQNSGAYPARNLGLEQATGDFITVHDADDWSHPEKIERQVQAITNVPGTVASASYWVRSTEDIQFTGWRITEKLLHWNHSSLMFTRKVLKILGPWDSVRVGADSEYHDRVCATFGAGSVAKILPDVPLSFGLDCSSSLTRTNATHVSTYNNGLRHIYREIASYWLRRPATSTPQGNTEKLKMLPDQVFGKTGNQEPIDTLFVADCCNAALVKKIEEAAASGTKNIAIFHQPAFDLSSPQRRPFCNEYFELLMNENIIAAVGRDVGNAENTVELA